MRLFSLFAGIGGPEKALERLGIKYELVGYSEIDRYASVCYSTIFDVSECMNYWDIRNIDEKALPDFDLLTWGFPCQDISIAGKQAGIKEGNRSGLYYDGLRILKEKKPKYSLIENVKQLTSKRFQDTFEMILQDLEEAGYNNYFQVLNARDYGIPQNRERVFIISIRKDVDQEFIFPDKEPLRIKLKDLLEQDVDEKFYLSDRLIECFQDTTDRNGYIRGKRFKPHDKDNDYAFTVTTSAGNRATDNYIVENKIILEEPLQRDGWHKRNKQVLNPEGISSCIVAQSNNSLQKISEPNLRIRKLTPLECWRLMNFDDEDFYKARSTGVSNTQLYKMAGNSIVVRVVEKIFENLFMKG